MNLSFVTVDSELSFDKHYLNIKKVKHDPNRRYWIDSFVLLTLIIAFQVYRAIYEKPRAWVLVIIGLTWIYPHLERLFKIIFIYKWGNRIKLNKVMEITVLPANNELETSVRLKLVTGRQKFLIFRNAENQHNDFIDLLKKRIKSTQLENSDS